MSKASLQVCDLTWSHFAIGNYLGLGLGFIASVLLSPYIALQIILWNNYEMYETVLAQAIYIIELKMWLEHKSIPWENVSSFFPWK